MNRCLIALGANIDASSDLFRAALNRLASMPNVLVERCSQAIRTSPVGANAGDEFLNAAATIRTDLSPLDLLSRCTSSRTSSVENGRSTGGPDGWILI